METNMIPTGILPFVLAVTTFWGGDKILSEKGAKKLYEYISKSVSQGDKSEVYILIEGFIDQYYSYKNGFIRPAWNVAKFTMITMLIMLSVYVIKVPDIANVLLTSGFLKQFIFTGFIVVFVVNMTTLVTYPFVLKAIESFSLFRGICYIAAEAILKAFMFLLITFLTWAYFSYANNSFGGLGAKGALDAMPITLMNGIQFKSLTSVYLYSVVISSLPLYIVFFIQLMAKHNKVNTAVQRMLFWLPLEDKPIRIASILIAFTIGIVFVSILLFIYPY